MVKKAGSVGSVPEAIGRGTSLGGLHLARRFWVRALLTRSGGGFAMSTDVGADVAVRIEAPIEEVWRAMTTKELIKRWFFGVDTETTWEVGTPIVHRGEWQGQPYEDKGEIVAFEPPTMLVHTHWSPGSGLPDEPENYERVTWTLARLNGATELTVSERNLPSEEAKATSEQSWTMALEGLRKLLEEEGV